MPLPVDVPRPPRDHQHLWEAAGVALPVDVASASMSIPARLAAWVGFSFPYEPAVDAARGLLLDLAERAPSNTRDTL